MPGHVKDFHDFRETLKDVGKHPNRSYFIYKSIIVSNLYGVDIMEEATEICKLRLFLKLAAQIEPDKSKENFGVEPLPDIDFNIRAGNTLVGFATEEQTEVAFTGGRQRRMTDESEEKAGLSLSTHWKSATASLKPFRECRKRETLKAAMPPSIKRQFGRH